MNTFRTISHVVVVAAAISVGNAWADKNAAVQFVENNKATIGAIAFATALPEDADAAKAAMETMGYVTDSKNVEFVDVATNFMANFVARKVGRCLAKNGHSLGSGDIVPGTVGKHVNSPIKDTVKAVGPQIIAKLVVTGMHMVTGSKKTD
ncbi:MAG TPA: hypothetical protein VJJ26_03190 [Candidatus Babeliales bacterium]|nr:hypothetical protein [Candidatus Babeliales bacterium]